MPSSPMRFECRNCNARYQLIRTKAGPKTIDRQVSCSECGAPFHSRAEGAVLDIGVWIAPTSNHFASDKRPKCAADHSRVAPPAGPSATHAALTPQTVWR